MCNGKITIHRTISKKKAKNNQILLRSQVVLNILFSRSMKNTFDKYSTKFVFFGMNISFLQYGKKHEMVKYRNLVNSFVSFHFFKDDGLIHEKKV